MSLRSFARVALAPPAYLALPTAGVDISASGIKIALLSEKAHGIELADFGQERLPVGAFASLDNDDIGAVVGSLRTLAQAHGIRFANIALPESRTYLFEADLAGRNAAEWAVSLEQHIDEYVPLPPTETVFDFVPVKEMGESAKVVGIGYARRVITQLLSVFDEADITVRAMESELFTIPRTLLRPGDTDTVLIIDVGKTTTKLIVASERVPRYATTLDIGGHALTLAVQKHFGVTEEEARRVKREQGLTASSGSEEYLAAMLSTVSAIREEVVRRLDYWQTHAASGAKSPVTRVLLVGGNANVKGLPEYLSAGLSLPVELGDVFTNFASRDYWLPQMDSMRSLAYATAIGLALRDYA